jgi:hypothetical protein
VGSDMDDAGDFLLGDEDMTKDKEMKKSKK